VLPKKYTCVELPDIWDLDTYKFGMHRDVYMKCVLSAEDKAYYGHVEDVLKMVYARVETQTDSEAHVLTNSRLGDLFDIIYEDAGETVFAQYEYLIDATKEGTFASSAAGKNHKVLLSHDLNALEQQLNQLAAEIMPCYADGLHWLVSVDENGQKYLSVFNNEGNERFLDRGDVLDHKMDKWVNLSFKQTPVLSIIAQSGNDVCLRKDDNGAYQLFVPAAGFAVIAF
jgi:hypothetical protein